MKTSVLLYSRNVHTTSEILAENLMQAGFIVEQSHLMNIPRIALNSYSIVHFLVNELPLTANEFLCLKTAQALGRSVVISVIDSNNNYWGMSQSPGLSRALNSFIQPDGFTVSQTNHLRYYRVWTGCRMILPALPKNSVISSSAHFTTDITQHYSEPRSESSFEGTEANNNQELYFPLQLSENFDDLFSVAQTFETNYKTYFDGQSLLEKYSLTDLRKHWQLLVQKNKIPNHYHLLFSQKKSKEVIKNNPVALVICNQHINNSRLPDWFELAIANKRFVILNEHQAAGFNQYWTSGQNCWVVSSQNSLEDLSRICEKQFSKRNLLAWSYETKDTRLLIDPLINELSRLYTKILHQKTRLLRADSATI